jgi:thiamine biosynthesis lipoprotein
MYGTSKCGNAPWRIAIEYPGKPDTAAGVIDLKDQAVAVSDSFRRRWGDWHHVVDPKRKRSVESVIGATAVAPSAWHADCMTSVLFLASPEQYPLAAKEFTASYLVFNNDGTCHVSPHWKGELF